MSEHLTVAALMPVHRTAEDVFRQAVQSVLLQSHPLDQLVVVDDSGDGRYEVILQTIMVEARTSCELRYVRNDRNLGLVKSLNAGIEACTTHVIARMDSDDISLPCRIETQLDRIHEGYDLVGGGIIKFGQGPLTSVRYPSDFLRMYISFLKSNPFAHPAVMYRKQMIQALGGYHEVAHAEDLDLWVRCLRANARMTNSPLPVLMYRLHADQVSEMHKSVQLASARRVRRQVPAAMLSRWMARRGERKTF